MRSLFFIHIVATTSSVGHGFAFDTSNLFPFLKSDNTSPGTEKSSAKALPTRKDGEAFLKELQLESSTTPKLAQAPSSAIPALVFASFPALFRLASGIFSLNYRLDLVKQDSASPADYSYLKLDPFQTKESGFSKIPQFPVVLYETENSPNCRALREACSMLSLTVRFRPMDSKTSNNRYASQIPPGAKGPVLNDPNTGREIVDVDEAIEYLFAKYGAGQVPWTLSNRAYLVISSFLGLSLSRLAVMSTPPQVLSPEEPVTLWAYEGSPFCLLVRQVLDKMKLEHTIKYAPRGSPNRQLLYEQEGRFQVPCFEDPNTGVVLFESSAIVEYLCKVYGRNLAVKYM